MFDSMVFNSAWAQVDATAEAIINDPALLPHCQLYEPVSRMINAGHKDWAGEVMRDNLRGLVKSLHNAVMNLGAGDYPINLLDFWKAFIEAEKKTGYSDLCFPGRHATKDTPLTEPLYMEWNYLEGGYPIYVIAKIFYLHATEKLKKENCFHYKA
jgi:hypothetical protein